MRIPQSGHEGSPISLDNTHAWVGLQFLNVRDYSDMANAFSWDNL